MKWKMTAYLAIPLFVLSCRKSDLPQVSTPLKKAESYYFNLKSNPGVTMPKKFKTGEEALSFLLSNYQRVDSLGNPYPGSSKASSKLAANTLANASNASSYDDEGSVAETVSSLEGASSGFVSGLDILEFPDMGTNFFSGASYFDFCPIWQADIMPTAKHIHETIVGYYPQRGIACVLGFYVKYAAAAIRPDRLPGKMFYGPSNDPYLTITGGALGEMETPSIQFNMNADGYGNISAHQVEKRTMILTSQSKWVFKAGDYTKYQVGMELENGVTITQSSNSITSYTLSYGLQFFDVNYVSHTHNPYFGLNTCDFSFGRPMLAYQDLGSIIVGVPRN